MAVRADPAGKRVLVVGAGPSGLSAAYHLARLSHHVEVRDAGAELGGMMRHGIPNYRPPRDVLDAEVQRIAALGVQLTCGHRVLLQGLCNWMNRKGYQTLDQVRGRLAAPEPRAGRR